MQGGPAPPAPARANCVRSGIQVMASPACQCAHIHWHRTRWGFNFKLASAAAVTGKRDRLGQGRRPTAGPAPGVTVTVPPAACGRLQGRRRLQSRGRHLSCCQDGSDSDSYSEQHGTKVGQLKEYLST
jgi:hypothetical protein